MMVSDEDSQKLLQEEHSIEVDVGEDEEDPTLRTDGPSRQSSRAASSALSVGASDRPRQGSGRRRRRRRRPARPSVEEASSLLSSRVVLEIYCVCAWDLMILLITATCCIYTIYAMVEIGDAVDIVASPFAGLEELQLPASESINTWLRPCTYPVFRFPPDPESPIAGLVIECPMQAHYYCPVGYACYSDSIGHPTFTTCALVNGSCDVESCKAFTDTLVPYSETYAALLLPFVGPSVGDVVKFLIATLVATIASALCLCRLYLTFKNPEAPLEHPTIVKMSKTVYSVYFGQLFLRLAEYLSLAVVVSPQEGVADVIQGHCFDNLKQFEIIGGLHVLNNVLLIPSGFEFLALAVVLFYVIFNHWRKSLMERLARSSRRQQRMVPMTERPAREEEV